MNTEQTLYSQNDFRNYSELYHHGVLGQKWGVRRYQNPDGTLTDEGRRHVVRAASGYESQNKRMRRITAGVRKAEKADRLDEKGFKALDKEKYDKAEKLFAKSEALNKVAQQKIGDATPEEIQLGSHYVRLQRNVSIAYALGGVYGAAGYAAYDSFTTEGKQRKALERIVKEQNKERKQQFKEKKETEEQQKKYSTKEEAQKAAEKQFSKDYARVINAKTEAEAKEVKKEIKAEYDKRMKEIEEEYKNK